MAEKIARNSIGHIAQTRVDFGAVKPVAGDRDNRHHDHGLLMAAARNPPHFIQPQGKVDQVMRDAPAIRPSHLFVKNDPQVPPFADRSEV